MDTYGYAIINLLCEKVSLRLIAGQTVHLFLPPDSEYGSKLLSSPHYLLPALMQPLYDWKQSKDSWKYNKSQVLRYYLVSKVILKYSCLQKFHTTLLFQSLVSSEAELTYLVSSTLFLFP